MLCLEKAWNLMIAHGILLIILASAVTAGASSSATSRRVVFTRVAKCPKSSSSLDKLRRLGGLTDERACFVECASDTACSVLHRTSDSVCYLGSAEQLRALFEESVSPECLSHVKNGTAEDNGASDIADPSSNATATTPLTKEQPTSPDSTPAGLSPDVFSKLLILFDFRNSYQNLANPSRYMATPRGSVYRDSLGAHFPGGSSDFIDVDTDGGALARDFLDHPRNFTFFARVERSKNFQQSYHFFHDCSGVFAGRFGHRDRHLWVEHSFPSHWLLTDRWETRQSTAALLPHVNFLQIVSSAAVFTGSSLSSFYMNQTFQAANPDMRWLGGTPQCLRLGFDSLSANVLNGLMVCYAVAKDALKNCASWRISAPTEGAKN